MEQLVHGQHELQGHLLHGQHEHWVKLLHGTVVQGRVNIASPRPPGHQLCAHMWSGGDKRVKAAILVDSCGLDKCGDVPEDGT